MAVGRSVHMSTKGGRAVHFSPLTSQSTVKPSLQTSVETAEEGGFGIEEGSVTGAAGLYKQLGITACQVREIMCFKTQ
jgi:hypothetical protein